MIELVLPQYAADKRTQPKSGQLWHDHGRQVEGAGDLRDSIRLDLCLVLLWRHLDGFLALGGCRSWVEKLSWWSSSKGLQSQYVCAKISRLLHAKLEARLAAFQPYQYVA